MYIDLQLWNVNSEETSTEWWLGYFTLPFPNTSPQSHKLKDTFKNVCPAIRNKTQGIVNNKRDSGSQMNHSFIKTNKRRYEGKQKTRWKRIRNLAGNMKQKMNIEDSLSTLHTLCECTRETHLAAIQKCAMACQCMCVAEIGKVAFLDHISRKN